MSQITKNNFKYLLVLDFDGVLSGAKVYNGFGKTIGKAVKDSDFTFIKIFKSKNIPVVFLTGDKFNEGIASSRKIPIYYPRRNNGEIDKKYWIDRLSEIYHVPKSNMIYVADDFFDVPALKEVGYSFCPNDSPLDVKSFCRFVLETHGGNGVLQEVYQVLESVGVISGEVDIDLLTKIDAEEYNS